jgi:ComF family protein
MSSATVSVPGLLDHAGSVLDLVFPRHCAACGGPVDRPSGHVCWECFRAIDLRSSPLCERCGLRIESPVRHRIVCALCQADAPAFERARSAGRFGGVLRDLLHQFKYGQATWLCDDLADVLHGCVLAHFDWAEVDADVPVPLHSVKRRHRGYNQAALLAGETARRLERPYVGDALARVRPTPTQTHLAAAARRRNVAGAFAAVAPEWVRGRTVLVVDDVMTTGATLSEAAATFKRAGARYVWAATVARG